MDDFILVDNDDKNINRIPEDEKINYMNFSPNFRSIWVGRKRYYQIFDFIDNLQDTATKRVDEDTNVGDVNFICENPQRYNRLYCLNSSPASVKTTNVEVIPQSKLTFSSTLLEIFYGAKVAIFVTESAIHSLDLNSGYKTLLSSNARNESVAAFSDESCSFAFYEDLTDNSNCNILIYDVKTGNCKSRFSAFENGLVQLMALNKEGNLLAVTDRHGAYVHVHNVEDGVVYHKFSRECRTARIHSMSFSLDSKFILVSADEGYIHGFNLQVSRLKNMLNIFDTPHTKFFYEKLPIEDYSSTKVCLTTVFSLPRVVVLSSKGFIYYYAVDLKDGGKMNLARMYSFPSNENRAPRRDDGNRSPSRNPSSRRDDGNRSPSRNTSSRRDDGNRSPSRNTSSRRDDRNRSPSRNTSSRRDDRNRSPSRNRSSRRDDGNRSQRRDDCESNSDSDLSII